MGASFSAWARWDDTVVQRVLASGPTNIQYSGPGIIQGAQNLTISGGTFIQNIQQASPAQSPELFRKVLEFLSLVNFRSIQQENLGKWTPGTIKWLLESSMFQSWLDTQSAILWGTGMPGAGKTILASVAIQYCEGLALASRDICVAFVYCRYTEPMQVRDILAALVRQLLERFPHLLSVVEPLYAQNDLQMTTPTQSELIDVVCKVCRCFRIAYLFIDGLDEALYDEQFDLLDTLKSVPANFFITSRPLIRLKDVLLNVEFFDVTARSRDIEILVSEHIKRNPDLRQVLASDEQRAMVIAKICQASHGMFLHASLMVEAVRHCTNSRHVMEKLDKLPLKLDVLYDEAFERIEMQPEEHAALAKRVLLWVAYAYRPLHVEDLRYAVASNPRVDWEAPNNLVPESLLVSVCCGLLTVEDNRGSRRFVERTVRFVHYTALDAVKRFFERKELSPHCLLAELCVERLMNLGVGLMDYGNPRLQLAKVPLLEYACVSWLPHARQSIWCPSQPAFLTLRFLATCKAFPPWDRPGDQCQSDSPTAPIHLVVYYQLPCLLPLIHPQVNERTKKGRSALSLAACQDDAVIAELLLTLDGIDVNLRDDGGNTALMLAAAQGSADGVRALLLDPRIHINKGNENGDTALHCALLGGKGNGHTEAALHLIAARGIDVNAAGRFGFTPLMLAYGHPAMLLDSLAKHPDIDFLKRDEDGLTPLMHACRKGTSSAVQRYLRFPGVNARDYSGATALLHRAQYPSLFATYEECLTDFRILVAAGLDVNEQDDKGSTVLTHTLQYGLANPARALLQLEGIDVNQEDMDGRTMLMVLCDEIVTGLGRRQTLDSLLQHPSLNINAKNRYGTTAVAHAVARGVLETAVEVIQLASDMDVLPPLSDGHRGVLCQTGLLREVPGLTVHLRLEEDLEGEASLEIIVTGKESPYPPGFRLSSGGVSVRGDDHRGAIEKTEACGFGFPWAPAQISETYASCARLLLSHPGIEDHGFGFL
ncbi:hypothetical protein BKA70DRAFT_1559020 [Coprinopsis sp. MPI-PUGE-AT-0042]|nr:hypothetical protein BKA70DRAFT_1559020 [Coprinopsis sp. MPI-PUGE-AT-0042]